MSIELVMLSDHFILFCPLLFLPSIFPSIRVFSNESDLCIRWPKYWSFTFSFSSTNKYSGLISFRIDWFDLLAVQGTFKSLLQHPNSKASKRTKSSSVLHLLYGPTLISVHDSWKKCNFDQMNLCHMEILTPVEILFLYESALDLTGGKILGQAL